MINEVIISYLLNLNSGTINTMNALRPRTARGNFIVSGQQYGQSLLGSPLLYFPASTPSVNIGLIIAGTHGDETAAVVALSCALRSLSPQQQRHHVVLAVNPDGCQLGLRANANGVDLNRNFPAQTGNQAILSIVGIVRQMLATWCYQPANRPVLSQKLKLSAH